MIAANAGLDGSVVSIEAKKQKGNMGFNALTNEWVDMLKAGIIDPAKVSRSALQNAASIASQVLTAEVIITDIPEPEKPMPPMPGGGMGGMY